VLFNILIYFPKSYHLDTGC